VSDYGADGYKPPAMLTVKDVSVELNCSEKTVRRLIWSGHLDAIKLSGLVRISRQHLADYKRRRAYSDR
jgi:excisionase family DNA binding protein